MGWKGRRIPRCEAPVGGLRGGRVVVMPFWRVEKNECRLMRERGESR